MVDKRSGQVEYAVLQFSGLFDLGSDYYPLPWAKLTSAHVNRTLMLLRDADLFDWRGGTVWIKEWDKLSQTADSTATTCTCAASSAHRFRRRPSLRGTDRERPVEVKARGCCVKSRFPVTQLGQADLQ